MKRETVSLWGNNYLAVGLLGLWRLQSPNIGGDFRGDDAEIFAGRAQLN
jgi:hypothetical protein